jgi:hypothetical protein
MVSFSGGRIVHGGLPVVAGVRYILPVFLFLSHASPEPRPEGGATMAKRTGLSAIVPTGKRAKRDPHQTPSPFSASSADSLPAGDGAAAGSHSFSFNFE